jgi:hypothetical protein
MGLAAHTMGLVAPLLEARTIGLAALLEDDHAQTVRHSSWIGGRFVWRPESLYHAVYPAVSVSRKASLQSQWGRDLLFVVDNAGSGASCGSSSAFALAWRNYSPRKEYPKSITPPRFYKRFCVPLRLGANWGYWPSDSVFDQGGVVHHKLLMILTWMGSFACHESNRSKATCSGLQANVAVTGIEPTAFRSWIQDLNHAAHRIQWWLIFEPHFQK